MGQWAADVVQGCCGEVLSAGPNQIFIRNSKSNRRRRIEVSKAVSVPQVGAFIRAPNGEWHKVGKADGNYVRLQAIKVIPKDMMQGFKVLA